jgi:hypothetical protein
MMPTSTLLTPGKRATASLILVAQDPQSMPDTVQSQLAPLSDAVLVIIVPSALKGAVVLIKFAI